MYHSALRLKIRAFDIICITLVSYFSKAQTLPIKNYSIQDGLPESRVYAVYLDPAGCLWAGTQGGVSKFDGHSFHIFDAQSGLPDNHVTVIGGGADGVTWFGHCLGKISYYKDGHITAFQSVSYKNNSRINTLLWHNNILYVGTSGNGLYAIYRNGRDYQITHFLTTSGLASNTVNKVCLKNKDELWVATDNGLNVFCTKSRAVLPAQIPIALKQKITAISQRSDTLFCGTQNGLLWYVKGKVTPASVKLHYSILNQAVNDVFTARNGSIWVATNTGVIQVNGMTVTVFSPKNGLLNDIIYSIGEDREHGIWMAQDNGISCFRDSPFELFNTKDGLIYNEVYSIEQDAKKDFWVATMHGITVFQVTSGGIKPIRDITGKDGLPGDFVYDLYRDSHGNMWVACAKAGAACFQTSKNRFIKFDHRNGLAGKEVVSISEDKQGRIWLATLDSGLAVYNNATKKFKNFTKNKGFVSNAVWNIHKDRNGQLWFGTRDQGLINLDTLTDRLTVIGKQWKEANYDFGSVTSDRQGNIWVATIGDGILKYNGRSFEKYGFRNGLKSNNPYFVFCDKQDEIWIGTNVGLDNLNPRTETTTSYRENDGFLGIETNQNAIYESDNGDLWIGTVKGLMHYKKSVKPIQSVPPVVYITKKQIFFKDNNFEEGKVRYDQNYVTFEYAGVTLSNASKILYKYKLDGLSDKWSPALPDSRVSYASLAPGNYTFMVKAGFSNGKWSSPTLFSFRIIPPFYHTWWFILLFSTLLYLICCWIYQYRVEQLMKFQVMRNKIASDLHDDIGSVLTSISIFSEVADQQLKRHDLQEIREVIGHIANRSRNMLDAMDDIVWAIKPDSDEFNDLFVRMREFANPLLEARAIEFKMMMNKEIGEISLFMAHRRNIYLIFKETINNILKHANCTAIIVTIVQEGKLVVLTITDNGKGFNRKSQSNRNGLKNIEKRAAEINARVDIMSNPGEGTIVKLFINVK
jgi:ligand-binding sensor domain-containing protein/two-component sensor histidine kinase